MLSGWGALPVAVGDGPAALAALEEGLRSDAPYELALVELQIEGTNGTALAEQIRSDARLRETPLVAMTATGRRGDASRCRKLGLDGYLTKPIMTADLLAAVHAVLGAREAQGPKPLVTRHSLREDRNRLS